MKFSSTLSSSMQRCLLPPILKSMASFSAAPFFWRIAQPSGEDQQNGKQTYCQLPSLSFRITLRTHAFKFQWTPTGFISLQSICEFSLKPVLRTMVGENLWCSDYWNMYSWDKKLNLFIFARAPKQNSPPRFLISSTREGEITHFLKATFLWKSISLQQKRDKKRRKLW